jgi:hypothetical protein
MSRIRLLGLCLVAVFALSAVAVSVAAAEEKTKMLPESGVAFTGKQVGEGELTVVSGGFAVKCKTATGSGTIESANLGKFKTTFKECGVAGGTKNCTTVGQAEGVITSEGVYHFWLAKEKLSTGEALVGALVELPTETHFTCVVIGFNQLVIVKGCVAALATPLNTLASVTKDTFALLENKVGKQLITKVLPQEKTTEESCILLSSKNGGAFEESALKTIGENENFKVGTTAVTVLLMNPEAKE